MFRVLAQVAVKGDDYTNVVAKHVHNQAHRAVGQDLVEDDLLLLTRGSLKLLLDRS